MDGGPGAVCGCGRGGEGGEDVCGGWLDGYVVVVAVWVGVGVGGIGRGWVPGCGRGDVWDWGKGV